MTTADDTRRRITDLPTYRPTQLPQVPPCQASCATHGDVRGWIGIVAQRRQTGLDDDTALQLAWERLAESSPFPATMGRICPHPCEAGCNRVAKDSPIAINALERFLGDWAIERRVPAPRVATDATGHSVGVVGAGPAGLSFAYQMARRGHHVAVYDRHEAPGGMLRYGIPDYRLPSDVLSAEIDRIGALGVDFYQETDVGSDLQLAELRKRHDAMFVAAGAQAARQLGVPGEDAAGVISGIDYLGAFNRGDAPALGARVAVIGGGNTAIDAARAARRAGSEVSIHYRRTRLEMPAVESEIDEAVDEGIELSLLESPIGIDAVGGSVTGLVLQQMQLGEPDASGRRRPEPIAGSTRTIPVDAVVVAVSQAPALEKILGSAPDLRQETPVELEPMLWIGGDAVDASIAGMAIRHGRLVAEAVHAALSGVEPPAADFDFPIASSQIDFERLSDSERAVGTKVDPDLALADPQLEVARGIDREQFLTEVDRCFSCGLCHGCSRCAMFCTTGSFIQVEAPQPGNYFHMDLAACTECGKCIEVCPCGFLTTEPVVAVT